MLLDISSILNAFNAAIILGSALVLYFISSKIKVSRLRILSLLLSTFLLVHGTYHLFEFYQAAFESNVAGFLSDALVEPLGWIVLFAFSIYFALRGG